MRIAITMAMVLAAAGTAAAQTGSGTCDGMMQGTVALAVPLPDGSFVRVPPALAEIGGAECRCDTNDLLGLLVLFALGLAARRRVRLS
jgi:hypothetical protein